jgi:processive 1,2-diacylglycerol beta-glucosyltransferase
VILSASSGAGHVRAAQALEQALRDRGNCQVEHIDVLNYVSKLFQRLYDDAYIAMVRRAPDLMGLLYDRMDAPWRHPRRRLALDRLNTQSMIRMKRVQPDLCIATHFLPAEILAWLIAKNKSWSRIMMSTPCGYAARSIVIMLRFRNLLNTSPVLACRGRTCA